MESLIAHVNDLDERTEDVRIQGDASFQSMLLSENIFKGLTLGGFKKPSPIQLKAIPLGRCGFDLIVKSKSGTGKTVVFSVIALEMVDTTIQELQVLVLAPTREIAVQIADVITGIGKLIEGLNVGTFIGGLPEKDDIAKLQNCHIAVGAPGRIKSLIKQNIMKTNAIKLFILDEADKLLEKQFQNDINDIISTLPLKKQVIALSATYSNYLQEFLSNYMQSATQLNMETDTPLLLGLKQFVKEVKLAANAAQEMKYKNEELLKLLACIPFTQCVIFSNYQTRAETVSLTINNHGWNSTFISAAQSQKKRLEVLENLKNFKCRILLSTDLTARGIDAANVDLIINYDVPVDVMTYLHRMGRAGRYGSRGICISLVSGKKDLNQLKSFFGLIGGTNLTIPKLPKIIDRNLDLWQIDPTKLEQISGTVDRDIETEHIKNEVLAMKNSSGVNVNQTDSPPETLTDQGDDDIKHEIHNPNTLLELMAEGQMDEIGKNSELKNVENALKNVDITERKKRKRTVDVANYPIDILTSLAKAEFDFSNVETLNKEMNCNKQISEKNLRSKEDNGIKNEIFLKNKALFEVAKILTSHTESFDGDLEINLKSYFNSIKSKESSIKNLESTTSILTKRVDNLDNVFLHAYQFAIEGKTHWKDFIPDNEHKSITDNQIELKEETEDQNDIYSRYDEESYEEDYEDIPGIEHDENGKRIYAYEDIPNRMVWVPVEKGVLDVESQTLRINLLDDNDEANKGVEQSRIIAHNDQTISRRGKRENNPETSDPITMNSSEIYNYDHFTECFRHCSGELWQNGLNFDSVEDFDNWFVHWQQRVQRVSDYVRQNLYVNEMSSYQNVKKFKK